MHHMAGKTVLLTLRLLVKGAEGGDKALVFNLESSQIDWLAAFHCLKVTKRLAEW